MAAASSFSSLSSSLSSPQGLPFSRKLAFKLTAPFLGEFAPDRIGDPPAATNGRMLGWRRRKSCFPGPSIQHLEHPVATLLLPISPSASPPVVRTLLPSLLFRTQFEARSWGSSAFTSVLVSRQLASLTYAGTQTLRPDHSLKKALSIARAQPPALYQATSQAPHLSPPDLGGMCAGCLEQSHPAEVLPANRSLQSPG